MIIDGLKVKEKIIESLKEETSLLDKKPTLAIIKVGNDPASEVYINQKIKMINYLNFNYILTSFLENSTEESIVNKINEYNNNKDVDGIIVQLPLPKCFNTDIILNAIKESKDIDGLTNNNKIKLLNNEDCFIPCTPLGIIKLLEYYNINVDDKNIVIIGRSLLVGKPLYNLLLNKDATVTMCHSKTKNLEFYTKNADILVVAVGKKHLITANMVKDNSIIIDVGINRINNKLYGDVDFENVKDKVKYITPVPKGVGPMTIAMLMTNLYKAYKIYNK